jgi:uncharacterized protein (DUF433 family)
VNILGRGVYNITEAAKLTQLRPGRVRAWFGTPIEDPAGRNVFVADYPPVGDDRAISFLDLIEVYIVGRLREASPRVSLQHIRKVHSKLAADTGEKHPFCSHEIYHLKGRIFTRRSGGDDDGPILEPLTDQTYINDVIMPFLERIEYDHITKMASRWHIADGIVVDPARCFGKPIVDEVGLATRVLAAAYEANGRDLLRVADWYNVEPKHVLAAVGFENRPAA